jgi:hypothetical protein
MHIEHLGERYFNIAIDWMVEFAVECAKGRKTTRERYRWSQLLGKGAAK